MRGVYISYEKGCFLLLSIDECRLLDGLIKYAMDSHTFVETAELYTALIGGTPYTCQEAAENLRRKILDFIR